MNQRQAILALFRMFVETVQEAGTMGAPGGVMYSAVMDKLTLDQFNQIMGALVQAGNLRRSGNLYFYVKGL